jgi:DNA-binding transcriptional LysR family regulator
MELRQLEHFVAVAEEGGFTRAARRVHIVQSGLSASVRALERDLGAQLLRRTTRRVELTEAGRALLDEARRTLAAAAAAREAVAAVQGVLRGRLSIGVMQAHSAVDLPAALGRFHAAHPDVALDLRQTGTADLTGDVRAGRLDLAVVAWPGAPPPGVRKIPLASEPMVLACPPGHHLARRTRVELRDLVDEAMVDFPSGWGIRMAVDGAFAAARLERRVSMESGEIQTLIDLVAHGLGLAVVPDWLARRRPSLRLVPFRSRAPRWEESIVTADPEPAGAAARAFLEALLAETTSDAVRS